MGRNLRYELGACAPWTWMVRVRCAVVGSMHFFNVLYLDFRVLTLWLFLTIAELSW